MAPEPGSSHRVRIMGAGRGPKTISKNTGAAIVGNMVLSQEGECVLGLKALDNPQGRNATCKSSIWNIGEALKFPSVGPIHR